MSILGRLLGRNTPKGFTECLLGEEHTLAAAGDLLATSLGLWLPDGGGHRRIGWHLISKVTWDGGALTVTESEETGSVGGAILLADRSPRRFVLAKPGKLPNLVRERVTGSIRSSHHRDLPGGGAWIVQRKVTGSSRVMLQVRADPGTAQATVRALAAAVAGAVHRAGPAGGAEHPSTP